MGRPLNGQIKVNRHFYTSLRGCSSLTTARGRKKSIFASFGFDCRVGDRIELDLLELLGPEVFLCFRAFDEVAPEDGFDTRSVICAKLETLVDQPLKLLLQERLRQLDPNLVRAFETLHAVRVCELRLLAVGQLESQEAERPHVCLLGVAARLGSLGWLAHDVRVRCVPRGLVVT